MVEKIKCESCGRKTSVTPRRCCENGFEVDVRKAKEESKKSKKTKKVKEVVV